MSVFIISVIALGLSVIAIIFSMGRVQIKDMSLSARIKSAQKEMDENKYSNERIRNSNAHAFAIIHKEGIANGKKIERERIVKILREECEMRGVDKDTAESLVSVITEISYKAYMDANAVSTDNISNAVTGFSSLDLQRANEKSAQQAVRAYNAMAVNTGKCGTATPNNAWDELVDILNRIEPGWFLNTDSIVKQLVSRLSYPDQKTLQNFKEIAEKSPSIQDEVQLKVKGDCGIGFDFVEKEHPIFKSPRTQVDPNEPDCSIKSPIDGELDKHTEIINNLLKWSIESVEDLHEARNIAEINGCPDYRMPKLFLIHWDFLSKLTGIKIADTPNPIDDQMYIVADERLKLDGVKLKGIGVLRLDDQADDGVVYKVELPTKNPSK